MSFYFDIRSPIVSKCILIVFFFFLFFSTAFAERGIRVVPPRTSPIPTGNCKSKMIKIPGGEYMAGSTQYSDEGPLHAVLVDGFCMDKYEVTQAEFERMMGNNPSHFKGSNRPVESVTWFDAKKYCEKVGKRLPTEAEWEKAARGNGTEGGYWYFENSGKQTHPVGQKSANGFGLHDMLGNVWEWTADWYGYDYYKNAPRHNPKGPLDGEYRVLRGGSWNNSAKYVRPAIRDNITPSYRAINFGFRCSH